MRTVRLALISLLPWLGSPAAVADQTDLATSFTGQRVSPFMRSYGTAHPPFGFVQFCQLQPSACQVVRVDHNRPELSPERLSELDAVNRFVNRKIAPATDKDIYGREEYWTIPTTHGDCEDYALLKREILIERGWPTGSLLMTVVKDEKGEGHAVLTVRTASGDLILDNKTDNLMVWHRTPYRFVMRQSYLDPAAWVLLDAGMAMAGASTSAEHATRR